MIALEHWTPQAPALALAGLLGCHEYGRRQLARHRSDSRTPREARQQAWLLRVGLAWGILTLISPLGYWSHRLMFARAGLALSFACLVAPLVVLGAPWPAFAAAWRSAVRWRRLRGTVRVGRRPASGGPVLSLAAFVGTVVIWQLPPVLDPSVRSTALWWAQICCYLAAGVLLWLQLVGSHPIEPGWDPLRRVALLAAAATTTWLAGVALVIAPHVQYPAFAGGPGTPLSKVMDQGLAGAITCVLPLLPLGITVFWLFAEWIRRDEDAARLQDLVEGAVPGHNPPGDQTSWPAHWPRQEQ